MVEVLVPLETLDVVICFFDHGDHKHENKRGHVSDEQANLQEGHELRKSDHQEEHVEEKLELVEEQFGEEAHDGILLVVELVRWKSSWLCLAVEEYLSVLLGHGVAHPPRKAVATSQLALIDQVFFVF